MGRTIWRDDTPMRTRESLTGEFLGLGVRPGDSLLVHASMSAVGWVCGGATTVVRALLDAVGPAGTVVVPAQTPDNRDPSRWSHLSVPERWWPDIRRHLPPFEPALTPSSGMGAIAERVRTWPSAARSGHPLTSFAAVGARAQELMAGHPLHSLLGEESPLGALERAGGRVLLLGVGFDKCTAFHLAEYRLPIRSMRSLASVVPTPAGPEWVGYESAELDDHDFGDLGAAYEKSGSVSVGMIGAATSRLFPIRDAVRFAEAWIARHRHLRSDAPPSAGDESENR